MFRRIYLACVMAIPFVLFDYVNADEPIELKNSIKIAALHQPGKIPYPLVTIKGSHVKMVTFTTYNGFQISDKKLSASVWATVDPELKQKCSDYVKNQKSLTHEQLTLWIVKLLGLPTKEAGTRKFVMIDVPVIQAYYGSSAKNIGIFRPCTDPRIGPHGDRSPICPEIMNPYDSNISPDYKTWFINNSITSYSLKNGVPWTEYGYTYNWNPQAKSVYGVSEFVVLKDTPINIIPNPIDSNNAYISVEDYCGVHAKSVHSNIT